MPEQHNNQTVKVSAVLLKDLLEMPEGVFIRAVDYDRITETLTLYTVTSPDLWPDDVEMMGTITEHYRTAEWEPA